MTENPHRSLPSVDRLAHHETLRDLLEASPELTVELARRAIDDARIAIEQGGLAQDEEGLAAAVSDLAQGVTNPRLRSVINATGVILQTNLGRAPLSSAARRAMDDVARGYSNLEFDLDEGGRGSRHDHLREVIRMVTGAESALVVNNNAAALLLALSTLANDCEVIISRGQAVEIGGGFRIPDVMRQSGARLVEVGTTNRTYMRDYESAVGPETAAVLRVHASNFKVVGFTQSASLAEMARVCREHGLLLIDDLGSGCLLDVTQFGLAPEPMVQTSIAAGADLTLFSGDKLLGGPQSGIIAGRAELIESLGRHPLARALRPDKSTIAALHATLLHYATGEAVSEIPVWKMISAPVESLEARAKTWAAAINGSSELVDGESMIGGGSLPGEGLPTRLLAVAGDGAWLTETSRRLRVGTPAVVARIDGGRLLFDPRTVDPAEDPGLIQALGSAIARSR